MPLVDKAKKEAQKNGKKLNVEVAKGLRAVQAMHDMCKDSKRSVYKLYISRREK